MSNWTAADMPDCTGLTVIITGANSGLGFEATKAFARQGATVVMACRSIDRGREAATEIRGAVPGADLDVRACDLADLDSVAAFADGVLDAYDGIHVLCNNAGVMAIPRSETADGFETQFGVNHLGHFALTGHLLERLVDTPGETRIVTQSSGAHTMGEIDFEDLGHEDDYGKWGAYGQSKLANLLFAYELQRRLEGAGVDGARVDGAGVGETISVACHPGYANTDLQFRGPREAGSRLRYGLMRLANAVVAQSAEQGALPMLYAATADGVDGGDYYGPGGILNARGYPERQTSSEASYDEAVAERLWTVSEELTGVTYDVEALAAAEA